MWIMMKKTRQPCPTAQQSGISYLRGHSLTFINECHLVLINKTLMMYDCSATADVRAVP